MFRTFFILSISLTITSAANLDPARYLENVKVLASDQMKGRGTGTPEGEKAAEYIARQFRKIGLQPIAGSYFQRFPVTTMARLGPKNHLIWREGGQ